MNKLIDAYLETLARKILRNEVSSTEAVLRVLTGVLTFWVIVVFAAALLIHWVRI